MTGTNNSESTNTKRDINTARNASLERSTSIDHSVSTDRSASTDRNASTDRSAQHGLIAANIKQVRQRIHDAALEAGRAPEDVQLMLAAKYQPLDNLLAAVNAGASLFGHNLIPQLVDAEAGLVGVPHYTTVIGHVQSNKLSAAMASASRIDTVDSFELAQKINRRQEHSVQEAAAQASMHYLAAHAAYPILLQVNSSGASSQFGCAPEQLLELAERISTELPFVHIQGLMTIGANTSDESQISHSFALTRELGAQMRSIAGLEQANVLSMGMTSDLELAVAHGSTVVRVGTAVFGARPSA